MNTLQSIYKNKLVAIIREVDAKNITRVARALLEGGINILEITAETKGFQSSIEQLNTEFGDSLTVGAGTVLDPETARSAIIAGAKFIFSPSVNVETIRMTKRYGIVCIPGAMTPAEILSAYENGADLVKVFPANVLGPKYLKDVHGPFPYIPLMPTGGVNLENVNEYFLNGAVAVGLGSALVSFKDNSINASTIQQLTMKAKEFKAKLN